MQSAPLALEAELATDHSSCGQPWPPAHFKQAVSAELQKQRPIVLPLAAMNLAWFAKTVITTAFLGRLGELELAGGALGFTFANVTGFSVLAGLCAAMEPICGQAFGARNYRLMHKSLLMATIMLLTASAAITLLWLNLHKILRHFGQQQDIIALARIYVAWLLPDLLVTSFLCPLKAYLSSQGITVPILVSSAIALALHVPVNLLLASARGLRGVAMATCITDLAVAIMLGVYVVWTERKRREDGDGRVLEGGWFDQTAGDWSQLLRLAGPCCLTTCLEWWCYEILVLLTGHLPNAKRMLAVLAVVLNFDYLLFSVMVSLATCTSTRVSNELGAGNSAGAHIAARVSLGISVISGCLGGSAMAAAGSRWGRLFSHDRGVVHGVRKMMLLMAIVEVVNFPLAVCGGIVRGTARPQYGMYATLGGFYVVALPLAVLMAFKRGLRLAGLLLGFLVGALTSLTLLLVFVGKIQWAAEARKAQVLASDTKDRGISKEEVLHG